MMQARAKTTWTLTIEQPRRLRVRRRAAVELVEPQRRQLGLVLGRFGLQMAR